MAERLSARLLEIVDALPLRPGIRVLEIGCGPGAAAREIARRVGDGYVLGIDRSGKAIAQARAASKDELSSGRLALRQVAAEDLVLGPGEARSISPSRSGSARSTVATPKLDGARASVSRRR